MLPRRSLSVLLVVAASLAGCGDDPTTPRTNGSPALAPAPLSTADGTTLEFAATDRWGEAPTKAARKHLEAVLAARLVALGIEAATVDFSEPSTLTVVVPADRADSATAATADDLEFRFRIRAPAEIENEERQRREDLGQLYRVRDTFAWAPLEIGGEVLLYVPEAPIVRRLEALRSAQEPDEAAITDATLELRTTLLREVFSGADLSDATNVSDIQGNTIRVTIRPDRQDAFAAFTEHYITRQLAVVVDGVVIAAPTLSVPLVSGAALRKPGTGFERDEALRLAERLRRAAWGVHLEPRQ